MCAVCHRRFAPLLSVVVRQKLADAEATLNVRQEELNQLTVQKETARLEAEQRFGSLRRVLFGGSSCSTPVLCC